MHILAPPERLQTSRPSRYRRALRLFGVGSGIAVTVLIVAGQILFLVGALRSGALTSGASPSTVPVKGSIDHRLQVVLAGALGPSDRGVQRFEVVGVQPDRANNRLADVVVRWAINGDLSAGTIGNGAQAEAYAMVRDIFTAHLPIASLVLEGTYPLSRSGARLREAVVMKLAIDRSVALAVGRAGWDGIEPASLWPLLRHIYVDPRMMPLPPE